MSASREYCIASRGNGVVPAPIEVHDFLCDPTEEDGFVKVLPCQETERH